jgi:methyl-accepting chemotaxis protein
LGVPSAVATDIRTVNDGITAYHAQFKQVAEDVLAIGLTEEDGLRGKLCTAVHNVEERLNEFGADEMLVKMLMMRRHEKDFLLRVDAKYIGRIDDRRSELKALLDASDINAATRREIEELTAVYVSSFKELAGLILDLDEKTSGLSKIFADLEPVMQAVADAIQADGTAAIAKADQVVEQTKIIIPTSIAVVTLVAAFAGFGVARTINNPILAMTATMGELANGKRDVDVPATDYGNEIGRMAQSVVSFRDSLREADRLAEEQRQAQQKEVERADRLMKRTSSFDTLIQGIFTEVGSAVTQMGNTAGSMDKASSDVQSQAATVASSSSESAMNVQTVAAATEEHSASFVEIGNQIQNAAQISRSAVDQAESSVQSATGTTVTSISAFSKTITEVDQISAAVAAAIEEQTAATREISRNVEEAAVAVEDVSKNIQYVNESAEVT